MRINTILIALAIFFAAGCAQTRIKDHPEWQKYFDDSGIKTACFEMRDNNHESIHYYNKDRCSQRLLPASTFKVFLALVALETAVAPDDQLVIKWDSVQRNPAWDKDMTLREALQTSSEPYFRELIRRIGPDRMKRYIDTVKYGNMQPSGNLDEIWTNNTLQITADEELGLLKKLYFYELPFSERSQRIVKTMMLAEQTPGYKLYYKTGTGLVKDKYVYWVVGFAERVEHVKEPEGSMNKSNERNYPYFFAMNYDIPVADSSKQWVGVRIGIVHRVLRDYGAIPQ